MKPHYLMALLLCLVGPNVQAASFECIYAQPGVEEAICTHEDLSQLDETLSKYYNQLRTELPPAQADDLRKSQREWLVERDKTCADANAPCLRAAYIERMNVLSSRYENTHPPAKELRNNQFLRKQCDFPGTTFPGNMVVYSAGAYHGKEQDYQIDQSGHVAGEFEISVNSKDRPVALLLSAYDPSIFKVSYTRGTRVVAVVASGYLRQAVAGLPPETPVLVTYYKSGRGCPFAYLYHIDNPGIIERVFSGAPISLRDILRANAGASEDDNSSKLNTLSQQVFGRPIDQLVKTEGWKAHLGDPLKENEPLVQSPIDLEVFKNTPEQLAGLAGLEQAVKAGQLRLATIEDRKRWIQKRSNMTPDENLEGIKDPFQRGDRPLITTQSYVIQKPFRIPDGLYGGNLAVFFLPEGVPFPKGDLGHSQLYDFNTMRCHGGICFIPGLEHRRTRENLGE